MHIDELIPGLNLEDYTTEFKEIIEEGEGKNGYRKEIGWLKELCAFANTNGGILYVGIHDKSHEILSLDHATIDSLSRMVHRLIKEHVEPFLHYTIKTIPVPDTKPTRYIMAIAVKKSLYPPVSLKFNGIGVIYTRHFGETSVATNEEIRYMILNSDQASYDTLMDNSIFDKNDFKILYSWYQKANDGKGLTEKDLLNIGFMTTDGRLKKGSLLFKDDYDGTNTYMECSQFSGAEKGVNEFRANEEIKGNLLLCFQKSIDFVLNHSANGFVKTAQGKKDLYSFPKRSLMEGIVNAIGHRNYFFTGYTDRMQSLSRSSGNHFSGFPFRHQMVTKRKESVRYSSDETQ